MNINFKMKPKYKVLLIGIAFLIIYRVASLILEQILMKPTERHIALWKTEQLVSYGEQCLQEMDYEEAYKIAGIAKNKENCHRYSESISSICNRAIEGMIGQLIDEGHYVEAANLARSERQSDEYHFDHGRNFSYYYNGRVIQNGLKIYNTKGSNDLEEALSLVGAYGYLYEGERLQINASLDMLMSMLKEYKETRLINLCKTLLLPIIDDYGKLHWDQAERIKEKY